MSIGILYLVAPFDLLEIALVITLTDSAKSTLQVAIVIVVCSLHVITTRIHHRQATMHHLIIVILQPVLAGFFRCLDATWYHVARIRNRLRALLLLRTASRSLFVVDELKVLHQLRVHFFVDL